jgi:hypothetical protein
MKSNQAEALHRMKALIIYDDVTCAANMTAILHRVAHHADMTVKWKISPWRLNLLKFPPTAKQALGDAAAADLIVFAVRCTPKLPLWLMEWLEEWARYRHIADAAVAIIGDGTPNVEEVPATAQLSQFARRHGLNFIFNNHGGIYDKLVFIDRNPARGGPCVFLAQPYFGNASSRQGNVARLSIIESLQSKNRRKHAGAP